MKTLTNAAGGKPLTEEQVDDILRSIGEIWATLPGLLDKLHWRGGAHISSDGTTLELCTSPEEWEKVSASLALYGWSGEMPQPNERNSSHARDSGREPAPSQGARGLIG